jgi:hypothetical protein
VVDQKAVDVIEEIRPDFLSNWRFVPLHTLPLIRQVALMFLPCDCFFIL